MANIPLTEDLVCLRTYIMSQMQSKMQALLNPYKSPVDWSELAKHTMSRLILFNKRRRAEVKDLRVEQYEQRPAWSEDLNGEMEMALSPTDKLLTKRYL